MRKISKYRIGQIYNVDNEFTVKVTGMVQNGRIRDILFDIIEDPHNHGVSSYNEGSWYCDHAVLIEDIGIVPLED
jgi:hypothetical protein